MQCRHCEDAPCVTVCPTGAIHRHKTTDPVVIDRDMCIGCHDCIIACPFGVIDITRDGKAVTKCDLCLELTEKGQEPPCVATCPTGALEFTELSKINAAKRQKIAQQMLTEEKMNQEKD